MAQLSAGLDASAGASGYERHRADGRPPQNTLLHRLVEQHYPAIATQLAGEGRKFYRLRATGVRRVS